MADVSRITLPSGSAYDIKDAIRGVEYIVGTQTASTNAWTGVTNRAALFEGMMIRYYLPYAGTSTAATLNLTLSGGSEAGAKPVYVNNKTAVTTHFVANSVIDLTYSTKILSTGAWCATPQYWTYNNYYHGTCTTSASTAAKTANSNYYILRAGNMFTLFNYYSNTYAGALTLNVASTGAKPIYINGEASSSSNYTLPQGTYIVYYDGTNYYINTNGEAVVGGVSVQEKAHIQYNSSTNALDFVFD